MTHTDHEDGDQHDVQVNGDRDHHVTMGHTVLQLCECRSLRNRMLVSLRGGGGELGNLKP
jgi:hypothetical protein